MIIIYLFLTFQIGFISLTILERPTKTIEKDVKKQTNGQQSRKLGYRENCQKSCDKNYQECKLSEVVGMHCILPVICYLGCNQSVCFFNSKDEFNKCSREASELRGKALKKEVNRCTSDKIERDQKCE